MAGTNECENLTSWQVIPGTCTVVYFDENGDPNPIDFGFILDKVPDSSASQFDYSSTSHTVTHNGVPWQLNCGSLSVNPNTCEIAYTNEKGDTQSYLIPQNAFHYDAATCTVTILPTKGGAPITFPAGVPTSDVKFEMLGNKTLQLSYKSSKCQVELPNSIVACEHILATNTLRLIHCDGSVEAKNLPKAQFECVQLDDGTQVFRFNDGCGGPSKMFNVGGIKLDTDNLEVVGSVLQFEYSGDDEQPRVINVDFCDIVATHCNATIVQEHPDGFDFVDNAGTVFNIRWKNCCTYHGTNPATLVPNAPPAAPAGNYPSKQVGDTVIECHPNGTAYYTCIAGNWSLDFIKLAAQEVFIGPGEPPKDGEIKNWFNPNTCVVKYCANNEWVQPTNLVCQDEQPPAEKGGFTLWYQPSTCCFNILCEGVWISMNGQIVEGLLQALCVQIGDGPVEDMPIVDGKAVIRIPAPPQQEDIPFYCIRIGDSEPIFAQETPDGKLQFALPEYPQFYETCIRINGEDNNLVVPHLEDGKYFLDLAIPEIPEQQDIPAYCIRIGSGEDIAATEIVDGKLRFELPAYPTPTPAFDKNSLFNFGDSEPATDGSEGCFWRDPVTGCPHILFGGVWYATNGMDAQTA